MLLDLFNTWPIDHTICQHFHDQVFEIFRELSRIATMLNNTLIIFLLRIIDGKASQVTQKWRLIHIIWDVHDTYDQIH